MKHVILIHAHKDLDQLNALVEQLAGDEFVIYVNIDAKSALDPARVAAPARLVQNRIAVHWGDYSQVRATLNSLEEIVAGVPEFDKVVFISGQDFPLLPNAQLKAELDRMHGRELIECAPVGPDGWACQERYQYFYLPRAGRPGMIAARLGMRAMRALGLRRRMAANMRPFGGASWWALSRPCIEAILARVRAEPRLERYFRTVACPDELFFQTLLMDTAFGDKVVPNNFRYVAWPDGDARNPKILGEGDFEAIAGSQAHFCRKLDSQASAALVPLLQRLRAERAGVAGSRVPRHD